MRRDAFPCHEVHVLTVLCISWTAGNRRERGEPYTGELPAASGCNHRRSHIPVMVPSAYHLPHIKWRIRIELPQSTRIGHFMYFMTWFHATWCFSMLRSTHFKGFMYFVICIEIGSGSTVTSFAFLTSHWCLIWHQMFRNWQYCNVKMLWNDTVVSDWTSDWSLLKNTYRELRKNRVQYCRKCSSALTITWWSAKVDQR